MNHQPAFPGIAQHASHVDLHEGMDLRDYFAAKAMQSLILKVAGLGLSDQGRREIVSEAYSIADEAMKAREKPTITPAVAVETLQAAMKADDDYAWTWHCNIAVCFQDEGGSHENSNCAAARFMKTAFDIDVTKFDQWKSFVHQWVGNNTSIADPQ